MRNTRQATAVTPSFSSGIFPTCAQTSGSMFMLSVSVMIVCVWVLLFLRFLNILEGTGHVLACVCCTSQSLQHLCPLAAALMSPCCSSSFILFTCIMGLACCFSSYQYPLSWFNQVKAWRDDWHPVVAEVAGQVGHLLLGGRLVGTNTPVLLLLTPTQVLGLPTATCPRQIQSTISSSIRWEVIRCTGIVVALYLSPLIWLLQNCYFFEQ